MKGKLVIAAPGGAVVKADPELVVAALVSILTESQRSELVRKLVAMHSAAVLRPHERPQTMPAPAIVKA